MVFFCSVTERIDFFEIFKYILVFDDMNKMHIYCNIVSMIFQKGMYECRTRVFVLEFTMFHIRS